MRFLRPALTALSIGAATPALLAPAFAQTCACPPAAGASYSGPVIEAEEPPPPLPVYEQPPIPSPGSIWTPGYWAWNNYDYYWVPGVWVPPPQPNLLWTPGYWAFVGGVYRFHQGFWGPHVGFYGGVNYGFGYNGLGYEGGRWEGSRFVYNTTVNNFGGAHITNVYTQNVTVAPGAGRVSYNGGPGGVALKPTPEQERLTTEQHVRPTPLQVTQARAASMDATQFNSANKGKPAVAATERPGELKGPGAVPAKAAGSAEVQPGPAPNGGQKLRSDEKPPRAADEPVGPKPVTPGEPREPNAAEKPNAAKKTAPNENQTGRTRKPASRRCPAPRRSQRAPRSQSVRTVSSNRVRRLPARRSRKGPRNSLGRNRRLPGKRKRRRRRDLGRRLLRPPPNVRGPRPRVRPARPKTSCRGPKAGNASAASPARRPAGESLTGAGRARFRPPTLPLCRGRPNPAKAEACRVWSAISSRSAGGRSSPA